MTNGCSRPLGRLFHFLLISVLLAVTGTLRAQGPGTTTISDVVYRANGTPAAGTLLVSWPAFTARDGKAVAAGSLSLAIGPSGAVTVLLVPNEGATPAGTYYKVVFKLDNGTTATEFWTVPANSPTTISAIRATVMPAGQAVQYQNATRIQGVAVASTAPHAGEGLFYNETTQRYEPLSPGAASVPDATADVKGKIKLAGALGGTADAPTVPGLAAKADDTAVLHKSGDETATGVKQFDDVVVKNGPVVDPRAFAGADAGAKIQAAITSLGSARGIVDARSLKGAQTLSSFTVTPGVTVYLGAGTYTVSGTITVQSGGRLIGVLGHSSNGTVLQAANSLNANIIEANTNPQPEWWHWGAIENLHIKGNKANNTSGSGIAFLQPMGEASYVRNVYIQQCKDDGIYMGSTSDSHVAAQAPAQFENVALFENGRYGFNGNGIAGTVRFFGLSGDDNGSSFMHVAGYQSLALSVFGLKAEIKVAGVSDPVILIENVGAAGVNPTIAFYGGHVMASNGATFTDLFKLQGTGPVNLHISDFYIEGNTTNVVNDTVFSATLPRSLWSATTNYHLEQLAYGNTGIGMMMGRAGSSPLFANGVRLNWLNGSGVIKEVLQLGTDNKVHIRMAGANGITIRDDSNTEVAAVSSVGKGTFNGGLDTGTLATGTKPITTSSTTLNNNLNADLLDGKHASDFLASATVLPQTISCSGTDKLRAYDSATGGFTCAADQNGGGGLGDPGSNGIVKRTALNTTSVAASSDVIGLWTGTCNSSSWLRGDGACAAPGGAGTVTNAANLLDGKPVVGDGGTTGVKTLNMLGWSLIDKTGATAADVSAADLSSYNAHVSATAAHSATATPTASRIAMWDAAGKIAASGIPDLSATYLPLHSTADLAAGLSAAYINWNSGSGGSSILNKPTLGTAAARNVLGTGTYVATTSASAPASNKCVEFDTSGNLVIAGTNAACGSGGSMTWPAAAGIALYSGSSSWSPSISWNSGTSTATMNITGNAGGTATGLSGAYIDWNGAGGASILNKPTLGAAAAKNVLGTGTYVATTSASAPASNKCVEFDASGNLVIAGSNAPCGSGGSGDSISVNTTAATDANFGNLPAAEAGYVLGKWQIDTAATPDNISLEIPAASTTLGVVKMAAGCSGGNHVSSIGADGELTCSADTGGSGLGDPGSNGIVVRTALNTTAALVGTVVIAGGTNPFGTIAANTRYLVTANVTQNTSAIAVNQNNATIECSPGVTITRSTAGVNLFDVSGTGDEIIGCILDGASGSGGVAINSTGSKVRYERNTFQNWAVDGIVTATAGSVVKIVNNRMTAGAYHGIYVHSTGSDMSQVEISGNYIDGVTSEKKAIYAQDNANTYFIWSLLIAHNTIKATGTCVDVHGANISAGPLNTKIIGNDCKATGSAGTPGYSIFGMRSSVFANNTFDGAGYFRNENPAFAIHDTYDSSITANSAELAGATAMCIYSLDAARNTYSGNTCHGASPSSGSGGIIVRTAAGSAPASDNVIANNTITLDSSAASTCILISPTSSSATANNNTVIGNHCLGAGTAGSKGIEITIGTGTAANNRITENHLASVATGVSIGASVTGSEVANNKYVSLTTPWSFAASTQVREFGGVAFSGIPSNVANGSQLFVTDANSTCSAGSSTGSICYYQNSAWTGLGAGGSGVGDPGSNGIIVRTALNTTTARSIAGTTNEITVTNGDGTGGNPTISLPTTAKTRTGALTWTVGGQVVSGVYTIALQAPMGIQNAVITDLQATLDSPGSSSSTINVQRCTANCTSTTPTFGNIYATGLAVGNTVRSATCSGAGTCGSLTATINAGDQFKLNVSALGSGSPADLTVTLTYTYTP